LWQNSESSSTGISARQRKAQLAKGCEKLIPKGIRVSDIEAESGNDLVLIALKMQKEW